MDSRKLDDPGLWFVAVVAGVIGIIIGRAWGDIDHQARWIYDYQTLITGVMAVLAAFVTVQAMARSDRRQQKRHDAIVHTGIETRSMKLRRGAAAARALSFFSNKLSEIVENASSPDGIASENCNESVEESLKLLELITILINDPVFDEVGEFFGPDDYLRLVRIKTFINSVLKNGKPRIETIGQNIVSGRKMPDVWVPYATACTNVKHMATEFSEAMQIQQTLA